MRAGSAELPATRVDWDEPALWTHAAGQGWLAAPADLALWCRVLDDLSPGKALSGTYLDLWCRAGGRGRVPVDDPKEMALCAGFAGTRAERTWADRVRRLAGLGFVAAETGPGGQLILVKLYHPVPVLLRHIREERIDAATRDLLLERGLSSGRLL